jgi:hypothetical protein
MTFTILEDTEIRVGTKYGGFGDLRVGRRVRVLYEVRWPMAHARQVELIDAP